MRTSHFVSAFALGAALSAAGIGLARAADRPDPTARERRDCLDRSDRASKHADRRADSTAATAGDARSRTLTSETMGWYLDDIYRRMDKAGLQDGQPAPAQ